MVQSYILTDNLSMFYQYILLFVKFFLTKCELLSYLLFSKNNLYILKMQEGILIFPHLKRWPAIIMFLVQLLGDEK